MSVAFLDLNDCNLQLWHGATRIQSPGYALLNGQRYLFGNAARTAARVQPRNINTRFWWQLSTEALTPALGPARHTGDLAHAHLQDIYQQASKPDEWVFAVSGSMQRDQLSLLLGIAQQCPFSAVGLINRSVVLASQHQRGADLWHLEIQLHQSLLSRLERTGDTVQLRQDIALPGCGLLQLQERIVQHISQAFVKQTRFDPRRKAETEQALFDALPKALVDLRSHSEANIEVAGYRARILGAELEQAGSKLFDSAASAIDAHPGPLLADALAGLLPGLKSAFREVQVVAPDAISSALRNHGETVIQRENNLHYITALPCLLDSSEEAAVNTTPTAHASPAASVPEPTHLLQGAEARPLSAAGTVLIDGWEVYRGAAGWQLRGNKDAATVNGRPQSVATALQSGDRIDVGGGSDFTLIRVAE